MLFPYSRMSAQGRRAGSVPPGSLCGRPTTSPLPCTTGTPTARSKPTASWYWPLPPASPRDRLPGARSGHHIRLPRPAHRLTPTARRLGSTFRAAPAPTRRPGRASGRSWTGHGRGCGLSFLHGTRRSRSDAVSRSSSITSSHPRTLHKGPYRQVPRDPHIVLHLKLTSPCRSSSSEPSDVGLGASALALGLAQSSWKGSVEDFKAFGCLRVRRRFCWAGLCG